MFQTSYLPPLLHIYGMHKGILQEPDLDAMVTQVLLNVL